MSLKVLLTFSYSVTAETIHKDDMDALESTNLSPSVEVIQRLMATKTLLNLKKNGTAPVSSESQSHECVQHPWRSSLNVLVSIFLVGALYSFLSALAVRYCPALLDF